MNTKPRLNQPLHDALQTGSRTMDLLHDLSKDMLNRLMGDLKISVRRPGDKHARGRSEKAASEALLRKLEGMEGMRLLVLRWRDENKDSPICAAGSQEGLDWRTALHLHLIRLPDHRDYLPEGLQHVLLELIAGRISDVPEDGLLVWRRWSAMVRARSTLMNLKAVLEKVSLETRQLLSNLPNVREGGEPLEVATENYLSLAKFEREVVEGWKKAEESVAKVLAQLGQDLSTLGLLAMTPRDLLTLAGQKQLEERLAQIPVELSAYSPQREKLELLLALPSKIPTDMPRKDLLHLEQEARQLRDVHDSGGAVEVAAFAPVLGMLGRNLLEGKPLSEEDRILAEENLTGKFCNHLLAGQLRLLEELEATGSLAEDGEDAPGANLEAEEGVEDAAAKAEPEPGEDEPVESEPESVKDEPVDSESEREELVEPEPRIDEPVESEPEPRQEELAEPESETAPQKEELAKPAPQKEKLAESGPKSELEPEKMTESASEPVPESSSAPDAVDTQEDPTPGNEVAADPETCACSFSVDATADQMAGEMLKKPELHRGDFEEFQAQLLCERRFIWVHWLATGMKDHGIPPYMAKMLLLGLQLQPGFQRSEAQLRRIYDQAAFGLEDLTKSVELSLLLVAASVRPALMAPMTHPTFMLRQAADALEEKSLTSVSNLAKRLASFAERMTPLSSEVLRGLTDLASWEEKQEELSKEIEGWFKSAPQRKTKFGPATSIWHFWTRPKGRISALLSDIHKGRLKDKVARERLDTWLDESTFIRRADRTDRKLRRSRHEKVRHGALDSVYRYVEGAVAIGHEWLDLQASRPGSVSGKDGPGKEFLQELSPFAKSSMEAIDTYRGESSPRLLRASSCCLHQALVEVRDRFQTGSGDFVREDPMVSLGQRLYYLPEVDREPARGEGTTLCRAVVRHLAHPLGVDEAISGQLDHGRIDLARNLLESAAAVDLDKEQYEERFVEQTRRQNKSLQKKLEKVQDQVEMYHLHGVINGAQRNAFADRVQSLQNQLSSSFEALDTVSNAAEDTRSQMALGVGKRRRELEQQRDQLFAEVVRVGQQIPEELEEQLDSLLEREDFSGAEEVLARVRGADLEGEQSLEEVFLRHREQDYFAELMARIEAINEQGLDLISARRQVLEGTLSALPELGQIDAERRELLGGAFDAWIYLERQRRRGHQDRRFYGNLFKLLRWLGFQVSSKPKCDLTHSQGPPFFWRQYEVEASIEAPIPLFGSMAGKRHTIILAWKRPEPGDLARWLTANTTPDQAVTVLHFERLSSQMRRRFIHSLRKKKRSALLLDTGMLLWLCAHGASERTRALFGAGLAGAPDNPYTPEVAGSVPVEMFFGREEDVDRLWARNGPCVVFGGRQLGKSALLQQVIRRYHAPERDQHVLYVGAKYETKLWDILRAILQREGLLKLRENATPMAIKDAILKQIQENPARRILVLLDECDDLLDLDSDRHFEQLVVLRDLMTEAERRFKVVFTGLHNVQRFQRIPNQPLAHFGEPLCIGPLPPRDAANLVERPLSALGYRFDPPGLVHRVLAFTNSHPSLLQLFCNDLVEAMLQIKGRPEDGTPPFIIDGETIARVYRRRDLRKKMRDRFEWTLNLDTRYRAIGYTYAGLELNRQRPGDSSEGLTTRQVLEEVRDVWPAGFQEVNEDELGGLLEEMVGLGLLIGSPGRRYRLRSPNVLRLIGGQDEVLEAQVRFQEMESVKIAAPLVVHRPLKKGKHPWVTSPFTMQQEVRIMARERGIDLIIGSQALDLARAVPVIGDLLAERARTELLEFDRVEGGPGVNETLGKIQKRYKGAAPNRGLHLEVRKGKLNLGQYSALILQASTWLEKLYSRKRYMRLVFCVGPAQLLELHRGGVMERLRNDDLINLVRLRRWKEAGLQHWFDDVERALPDKETMGQWFSESGGWPLLLVPRLRAYYGEGDGSTVQAEVARIAETIVQASGLGDAQGAAKLFSIIGELDSDDDQDSEIEEVLEVARELAGVEELEGNALTDFLLDLDLISIGVGRVIPEAIVLREASRNKGSSIH